MINKVVLCGNLTRDPELATTNSGKKVCNYTIAVSYGGGEDSQTFFFNIKSWNAQAEVIYNHCKKGDKITVVGALTQRSYEKDGKKITVTEILAQDVEFMSRREKQREEMEEITDEEMPF